MNLTNFALVFAIVFFVFVIVASPLAAIWCLNTLFPALAIPYTFNTWFAMFFLTLMIKGACMGNNSSNSKKVDK
jgi:hypothetical protein